MTTHHYELPKPRTSPWGGLSDEAKAALANVATGTSVAGELLTGGVATARELNTEELRPEVKDWACAELNVEYAGALKSWKCFETVLGSTVPSSLDELLQTNPNLTSTLNRLHDAKRAIAASGEITPENKNIGRSMHILAVPWQAISDNRIDIVRWLDSMRHLQGIWKDEWTDDDLLKSITEDRPLYRLVDHPIFSLTSTEYLAEKIEQDGPWGVVLAQIDENAGIVHDPMFPYKSRSSNDITNGGADRFKVAGHVVDSMGIYEWLSLTLQEKASGSLPNNDSSLILANRTVVNGERKVPVGAWGFDQVMTELYAANVNLPFARPRLMVM